MTKLTQTSGLLIFWLVPVLFSCKKSTASKSRTELITQAIWKIDKVGLDINNNNQLDAAEVITINACNSDDVISFSTNGTGYVSDGQLLCNSSAPPIKNFVWSLSSDQNFITIDGDATRIESVNDDQFVRSKGTPKNFIYFKH